MHWWCCLMKHFYYWKNYVYTLSFFSCLQNCTVRIHHIRWAMWTWWWIIYPWRMGAYQSSRDHAISFGLWSYTFFGHSVFQAADTYATHSAGRSKNSGSIVDFCVKCFRWLWLKLNVGLEGTVMFFRQTMDPI